MNYMYCLLFISFLSFIQCKNEEEYVNTAITKIEFIPSKVHDINIEQIFDSIRFLPLKYESDFVATRPEEITLYHNKLFYLTSKSGDQSSLFMFNNQTGQLIDKIISNPEGQDPVHFIRYFDALNDTVFLLNNDHLSKFTIIDNERFNRVLPDINLTEWYTHIVVNQEGYICFNQSHPYALYFRNHDGVLRSEKMSFLNKYPTFQPDNFQHFRRLNDNTIAFHFRYNPNIYRIKEEKRVETLLQFDFNEFIIDSSTLNTMATGSMSNFSEMKDKFCNKNGMFCSFYRFFELGTYYYISFKVNNSYYIVFTDKRSGKSKIFNGQVDDITDFRFLGYFNKTLDFITNYENALIAVLDSEYLSEIIETDNPISSPIINNFENVKHQINNLSNPVIVFFYLKKNLNI